MAVVVRIMMEKGKHMEIYNIGNIEEVSITDVAHQVGDYFKRKINVVAGDLQSGSALRRCPDVSKLARLGYSPSISLRQGLPRLAAWYEEHANLRPDRELTSARRN